MPKETPICFVIAPIGEEGTEIRARSDQILTHVIKPVCEERGYSAVRADEISEPGVITSQIIQHVIEDSLVIADLTGRNPNVFYELAVRHAVRKPVVQLIQSGETIPFDVAGMRTIPIDHHDLDSVKQCMTELIKQIQTVEEDPTKVDSPISVAVQLQSLRQSENPLEKSNAEIISMLQELRATVLDLVEPRRLTKIHPRLLEEMYMVLDRVEFLITPGPGERVTKTRLADVQTALRRGYSVLEELVRRSDLPPDFADHMMMRRRRRPDIEGG